MANQYANKVIINSQTVIDLTSDTVTESDVTHGKTFHDSSGALKTGTKPDVTLQSKTVSPSTSQQVVEADTGYDGLDSVTVNAMRLQEKTITAGRLGHYVYPDDGYDGLSLVDVRPAPLQTKTITTNGTHTPDTGYEGFEKVVVNVTPASTQVTLQSTDSERIEYPPSGYDAISSVKLIPPAVWENPKTITSNGTYNPGTNSFFKNIVVNVPQTEAVLQTKTLTANGTYNASDDDADGYSKVTVAVSGGGGATVTEEENEFGGITMTITE